MKIFKDPRRLIRLVAIVVLLVVGGIYAERFFSAMTAQKTNQEAKDLYYHSSTNPSRIERESNSIEESVLKEESTTIEESVPDPLDENGIAIDFHDLLEINDEIVGWLTVADRIDFPVVHGDNDFYLYHDFKKNEDGNGSIFLNSANTLVPRDDVLMIFGHDMNSGAMFAPLLRYMEYTYLKEFPVVSFRTIYDPGQVYYTPVASIDVSMIKTSSNYFDIKSINFKNDPEQPEEGRASQEFQDYLDSYKGRVFWEPLVEYDVNDRYILLITCSYNSRDDDRRFCLLCRQLRPEETPEKIEQLYKEAH